MSIQGPAEPEAYTPNETNYDLQQSQQASSDALYTSADPSAPPAEGIVNNAILIHAVAAPSAPAVSIHQVNVNDTLIASAPETIEGAPAQESGRRCPGRVKGYLLIALAATVVAAAVVGGACGSGACSGSSQSGSTDPSSLPRFIYVAGFISSTESFSGLENITVYDFEGNPHPTNDHGYFEVWARPDNISRRASLRVSAPGVLPTIVTIPVDEQSFPVAKVDVRVSREAYLSQYGLELQTVTGNASSDGILDVRWTTWGTNDSMRVSGLNHPSFDGRTFVVRAGRYLLMPGENPGEQRSVTGEPLSHNGWMFYFDLSDPVTGQSIPLPPGVVGTINVSVGSPLADGVPLPPVRPWRWWKQEANGLWNDTQTTVPLPASTPLSAPYIRVELNITGAGYWQIARPIVTRCVRSKLLLDSGVPCAGAQVRFRGDTSYMPDRLSTVAFTRADGSFCLEGYGAPSFSPGSIWVAGYYPDLNQNFPYPITFDDHGVHGSCAFGPCHTLPDVRIPHSYLCTQPAAPTPPPYNVSGHGPF